MTTTQLPDYESINELRIAFGAICGHDFSDASITEMSAVATEQLEGFERELETDKSGAAAIQVALLRELLTLAVGHAGHAVVH